AQSAIELLERTAEAGELARAHCALLRIEAVAFEPSGVIAAAPRALELAARAGSEEARIDTEITLGLAYGHVGRAEAATVLARARAARGRREWFGEVPLALVIEALVRARRGEQGPDALLDQALAGVEGLPAGWRHAMLHAALAEIAWLRGDRRGLLIQVEAVRGATWFAE